MSLIRFTRNYPTVFDQLFDSDLFDRAGRSFAANVTMPSVNVREGNDKFMLEFAAPGFSKEDFKIELDRNVLTVSSEKKTENEKVQEEYRSREFSYQSFSRSFTLPESVEVEKIDAKYDNGILTVQLPKRDSSIVKPSRMIEIN